MTVPLDPLLHDLAGAVEPRGDVRRELELLQQFGAPASVFIAFLLTLSLAPDKARRFLDWALAAGVTAITVLALKILIARPRPSLDAPFTFNTAFTPHPLPTEAGGTSPTFSWQLGADGVEQLWAMPSSHTSGAVVFAVFLAVVFPKLRVFAIAMATIVAACRVLFSAHWPADVFAGAAVALSITPPLVRNYAGVRLLDAVWIRFIDRSATPAFPRIADADGAAAR